MFPLLHATRNEVTRSLARENGALRLDRGEGTIFLNQYSKRSKTKQPLCVSKQRGNADLPQMFCTFILKEESQDENYSFWASHDSRETPANCTLLKFYKYHYHFVNTL